MIEAELKARVEDVEAVQTWLRARAEEEVATYYDIYYDYPDHRLDDDGREIRLRTIATSVGTEYVLTYKQPPADEASGSKPEHETVVSDTAAVDLMVRDLGLVELVSLTKNCLNYRFGFEGCPILATLVTVPELVSTFLEVETLVEERHLKLALDSIHAVIGELGLSQSIDRSKYTDEVRKRRNLQGFGSR